MNVEEFNELMKKEMKNFLMKEKENYQKLVESEEDKIKEIMRNENLDVVYFYNHENWESLAKKGLVKRQMFGKTLHYFYQYEFGDYRIQFNLDGELKNTFINGAILISNWNSDYNSIEDEYGI